MTAAHETDRREGHPREVTIVAHDIGTVGGTERVLCELITGLRTLGHPVSVIARTCELPRSDGVAFHRIRGPARPLLIGHPWFLLVGSLALWRHRRGVVQATGAIVLNRVDIVSVHYCHQVGPTNPSRQGLAYRLNARAAALLGWVAEHLCFRVNNPSRFVCVSEGVADEMREHFPGLAERVQTIHNGVDTQAFAPGHRRADASSLREQLSLREGRLLAAFVGGEWERKGLSQTIESLALAPGWDLVVAGHGDRVRYQALADSLGVGESVHWLGVVRDVAPLYELADALVFPTNYEAFPLVALEAAASGLPILATPVSGVRELIDDGKSGFLIDREAGSIATRLRQLALDPALRAELGQAARRAAIAFSWTAMVEKHARLYAEITAARR